MKNNISFEGHEATIVREALLENRRLWRERIFEAESGKRPNFSVEGARLIIADIDSVLNKIA
jgi:hypothetical protein